MIWMFDDTDMRQASKHLGGWASASAATCPARCSPGTPEQVEAYVKDLLDDVAGDGGYILASGIVLDDADPACLRMMLDAFGKKYGAEVSIVQTRWRAGSGTAARVARGGARRAPPAPPRCRPPSRPAPACAAVPLLLGPDAVVEREARCGLRGARSRVAQPEKQSPHKQRSRRPGGSTPRPAQGPMGWPRRLTVAWTASPAGMGAICSRCRCQCEEGTKAATRAKR